MAEQETRYTFDRVVRMLLTVGTLAVVVLLTRYLSDVLIPFAAAVAFAYLLNPLVTAFERATQRRGLSVAMTLGGLGIVVLFVAVLPMLGVGGRRMYRIEAPGPAPEGVTPRIRDTARILWLIYLGLTLAEILALRLCAKTIYFNYANTLTLGYGLKRLDAIS